jgi:hypothetical protein
MSEENESGDREVGLFIGGDWFQESEVTAITVDQNINQVRPILERQTERRKRRATWLEVT